LWFLFFLILILIAVVFIVVSIVKNTLQRRKALAEELDSLAGFKVSQSYLDDSGNTAIAIDRINKKICLLKHCGTEIKSKIVSYRDLLSAEVLVDGTEVVKTSRGSQLGGAILGGIIDGGVGAIIGGLSGSKTSIKKVNSIRLQIVINDSSEPIHLVNFLEGENDAGSFTCRQAMDQARYWQGLLSVFITQADREDKEKSRRKEE